MTLKNRLFQPRRGRNNRIFYKGMEKTVFDYDSNEEDLIGFEKPKASKKRSYGQYSNNFSLNIDKLLLGQRQIIEDIEKHCKNKRLKKNIYKMDCVKIAQPVPNPKQETPVYNPAVTNASSDHEKLPRMMNDPVIDQNFKINNARLFQDIMT